MSVKRITKDALLLAILCLGGMFSIPFGDSVKVSLQILLVFIICYIDDSIWDGLIITSLYLVMGLFMPIYAGFTSGITPTFGYVISFVLVPVPIYFINKIKKITLIPKIIIGCSISLLLTYVVGTLFMYFYLGSLSLDKVLLISIVPYLPFDALKIALTVVVVRLLPSKYKNI